MPELALKADSTDDKKKNDVALHFLLKYLYKSTNIYHNLLRYMRKSKK
jgi:hypothetical protein